MLREVQLLGHTARVLVRLCIFESIFFSVSCSLVLPSVIRVMTWRACVQSNVEVELWDVSGDRAYEGAWPAIMHGGVGIVYVYDSTNVGQEKDLADW